MKKLISFLLAAALLLAVLPVGFSAAAAETPDFTDVPDGAWYALAVRWAVENGITAGVAPGKFGPNLVVTRAQAVTMLWRLENAPEPAGTAAFSDVPENQWYSKAVLWAAEHQIVAGYPGGVFSPNRAISRQELVTILYRYAKFKDSSLTAPDLDLSVYTDANELSSFALEPMRWAVGNGIVSGTSKYTLSPKGSANRAQLVQMLYGWLGKSGSGGGWDLPFIPTP